MKHLLASLLAASVVVPASLGQTAELLTTYTTSQLTATAGVYGIPSELYTPEFDVNMYRVTYDMPFLGDTVAVSGALFVPQGFDESCGLPVHVYMHGTVFKRTDAPSYQSVEGTFGGLMATLGQLVLMPDYVGLGSSELMHPYVHARSEADAGYFMMVAADALGDELGYDLNGQNFISGYSQGGHAAMALARDLATTSWAEDFSLTAAMPGSGPYDISGTQFPQTFDFASYSNPAYLAYNVIGWNIVYGTLYTDLSEVFQEPYASTILPMFDGTYSGEAINAVCPATLEEFVQPGLVEAILADPTHPFVVAAQDNDVYQWVPEVPVDMQYCTLDEQVFCQNALVAEDWMVANGSTTATATNLGAYDHVGCAGLAIFGGTLWIDGMVEACVDGLGEAGRPALRTYPNPADATLRLEGLDAGTTWTVRTATGQVWKHGKGATLDVSTWRAGLYLITADDGRTVRVQVAR